MLPSRCRSWCAALALALSGCRAATPPPDAAVAPPPPPAPSETYAQALSRAQHAYDILDLDEALAGARSAIAIEDTAAAHDLAARAHLAQLEFPAAIAELASLSDVASTTLRARALWLSDDPGGAAKELATLPSDSSANGDWGAQVVELARTAPTGAFFDVRGNAGPVTVKVPGANTGLLVSCEIDGHVVRALLAFGLPEVTVSASAPSDTAHWTTIRLLGANGAAYTIHNVPAFVAPQQDTIFWASVAKEYVDAVLGSSLLRRLLPSVDVSARTVTLPGRLAGPSARASVPVVYSLGSYPLVRLHVVHGRTASLVLGMTDFPPLKVVASSFDTVFFKDSATLELGSVSQGPAFVMVMPPDHRYAGVDVPVDGVLGASFFEHLRVTFADGGRTLLVE